jgi:hypothetical protein
LIDTPFHAIFLRRFRFSFAITPPRRLRHYAIFDAATPIISFAFFAIFRFHFRFDTLSLRCFSAAC